MQVGVKSSERGMHDNALGDSWKYTCKEDFHAVSKLSLGCHDLSNGVKNPIPHPFAAPGVPEALVHHGSCAHAFHPPSGWMVGAPGLCMQS